MKSSGFVLSINGKNMSRINFPEKIPYTTRAMLFPVNIVAINFEGELVNFFNKAEKNPFCFFSISRLILLDETKAISIPEKNAEKIIEINIINISKFIFFFFQTFFYKTF